MTDKTQKRTRGPFSDMLPLIIGEAIVVVLVCIGFLIADGLGAYKFNISIIIGAILGALVILGNHVWLILTVDKKVKDYFEIRGRGEMSEKESAAFTKKHSASIQKAMSISSVGRMVSMFLILILAFISGWFNPLATAIPMFTLRPILSVAELIRSKNNPKPDPAKFIKYEQDEDIKNEKEDE